MSKSTIAPIARAALALAQDDHTSGALRLVDNSELVALDKAVATALRLRGVERPGAEVEDMPINDGLNRQLEVRCIDRRQNLSAVNNRMRGRGRLKIVREPHGQLIASESAFVISKLGWH